MPPGRTPGCAGMPTGCCLPFADSSPKSSPQATHKPQVEPKRLALDLYLRVEEGAEVNTCYLRGKYCAAPPARALDPAGLRAI